MIGLRYLITNRIDFPVLDSVNFMCMIVCNLNVEHDIITHDACSVSWAEIWEFSKSQHDIIDAVTT